MNETIKDDLTHKIIGCAMKVHSTLGNGFQEVMYQRALAIEMGKQGLSFQRELEMPLFYDEQNQRLKEARDILLPRLMTGMIDVEQMSELEFVGLKDRQDA